MQNNKRYKLLIKYYKILYIVNNKKLCISLITVYLILHLSVYTSGVTRHSLKSSLSMGSMEVKTRGKIFSIFSVFSLLHCCRHFCILWIQYKCIHWFSLFFQWYDSLCCNRWLFLWSVCLFPISCTHFIRIHISYLLYFCWRRRDVITLVLLQTGTCVPCTYLVKGEIPNFPAYFLQKAIYERWNFNSGNYLFTTDTK